MELHLHCEKEARKKRERSESKIQKKKRKKWNEQTMRKEEVGGRDIQRTRKIRRIGHAK